MALICSYGGSLLAGRGQSGPRWRWPEQAPALTLFMKGDPLQLAGSASRHLDGAALRGAARFIAIWWCLLAFIASGYGHSVANMTLFALSGSALPTSGAYTLGGIGLATCCG